MPFKKGQSGNPKGRPKGAKDKFPRAMKERVQALVDKLEQYVEDDINSLDPSERIRHYTNLLEYVIPKLQRTENEGHIEIKVPRIKWTDPETLEDSDE